MSSHRPQHRLSVPDIRRRKGAGSLVALTAYSTPTARLLDPHADLLLVGDSLGMVLYGMPSTLGVSLEMMVAHTLAVMRGSRRACVVADLPFASYQESPRQAFRNAARLLADSGAQAVKLEGGEEMEETVDFLVRRGIPVLAHIGLMPQQVNAMGGFKAQGRDPESAERVRRDGLAMQRGGAFAVVIEGVGEPLARRLSEELAIPCIGIGASPACDGQVLVSEDLLGLSGEQVPRFVERYARLDREIDEAARRFAEDVRERRFPEARHCFAMRE